jgi:hypothetical protein
MLITREIEFFYFTLNLNFTIKEMKKGEINGYTKTGIILQGG